MKRIMLLAALMLFLCGFRAPDGEIISEGDPVSKVVEHLGQPLYVSQDAVRVIGSDIFKRETWTYKLEGVTYYLTIEAGKVTEARWSRVR